MTQELTTQTAKLVFVGAGNMASAIIGGLVHNGYPAKLICACDPNKEALARLAQEFGIETGVDNREAVSNAQAIILAVKPQVMQAVLTDLAPGLTQPAPLIISIAAGVTVNNIRLWLNAELPIVRTMPNTPALVQTGATGLYANTEVNATHKELAQKMFEAIGLALWFDEEADLDRVVALSGSGPAYFFYVMEALERAGVELGLSPKIARQLTLQTALGAAKLALADDVDPAELRRRVTSPGGTTEAAVKKLDEGEVMRDFDAAVAAAAQRSKELAG